MNNKTLRFIEQIISIPLWLLFFISIPMVFTHWGMVKGSFNCKVLKKASFLELKEKMYSTEWYFDPNYPCSLFDKDDYWRNYFHASIFMFDGVGYLMTPFGLLMANIYQRRIRKTLPNYTKSIKQYVD